MDAALSHLFHLTRRHTAAVLAELDICTSIPQVYILGKSLTLLDAPCRLVSHAMYSQEDWGDGFEVSTMIAALEFPSGDIISYLGVEGWAALQDQAEKGIIENVGPVPEGSLWDVVPNKLMYAIMSKELRDMGEKKITEICDRIIACVRSDLLRTETIFLHDTTARPPPTRRV